MRAIALLMVLTAAAGCPADANGASPVALLRGGRTFVPIRTVGEMLGATVVYAHGEIELATAAARSVHLTVGSSAARVNAVATVLDAPPFIMDDVCYVPLRFVGEALGAQVECSTPCRIVTVTSGDAELSLTVVIDAGGKLTYQGAWFDIAYPRGFAVHEREPSASGAGHDGASFISPDGTVEFYVFSPQWSGTSQWCRLRAGESVVSQTRQQEGDKTVTWTEVAVGDAAGHRAWVEIANPTLNVNHCFGIWFMHQEDYDRYQTRYVAFKESLVQYAD